MTLIIIDDMAVYNKAKAFSRSWLILLFSGVNCYQYSDANGTFTFETGDRNRCHYPQ